MKKHLILTILVSIIFSQVGYSQTSDVALTKSEKTKTVNSVVEIITGNYIFPETAQNITNLLQKKLKDGSYDSIEEPSEFAEVLTKDIQSFYHDRHLRVLYEPEKFQRKKRWLVPEIV